MIDEHSVLPFAYSQVNGLAVLLASNFNPNELKNFALAALGTL